MSWVLIVYVFVYSPKGMARSLRLGLNINNNNRTEYGICLFPGSVIMSIYV